MHDEVEFGKKNTRRIQGATTTAVRNCWLTTPHKSVVSEADILAKDAVHNNRFPLPSHHPPHSIASKVGNTSISLIAQVLCMLGLLMRALITHRV